MNVYPKLVEHEYHKGTGCWGYEMNEGLIMYIRSVDVDAPFVHQGVGTHLVQELLSPNMSPKTPLYDWRTKNAPIIAFFRKLGFRRVGRTTYFAYSPDVNHPSRLLRASADLDVDSYKYSRNSNILDDNVAARLRREYPLQTLVNPLYSHSEMISAMCTPGAPRPPAPSTADMVAAVRDAYSRDISLIRVRDEQGFTPIYVAASKGHLPVVETLLSLADVRGDILDRDNIADSNAIEAHDQHMRASVLFTQSTSPDPCAFLGDALRLQYILKQATGEDKRYGCTCGKCRGGWLSPRMAHILHWEGGFLGLCCALATVIERGALPVATTIVDEGINNTTNWWEVVHVLRYLEKGGKVEYVINHIVDLAKAQMDDGSLLEEMWENEEWAALPRCANDLHFDLVTGPFHDNGVQRGFSTSAGPSRGFYHADSDSSCDEEDEEDDMDVDEESSSE
ncbi:hypothetical protein BD626DRAFT_504301 [Schizophyllum amplum]|uniref:N-acetyltransferase domain-containing protein n=1 Tax=Schizophyllum amplum TaxID=97359 RepID=A0A550C6V8_9AGAR|nr:hypothetical protein BD626DRAFT_504301 [Auriculariopsis ampla]